MLIAIFIAVILLATCKPSWVFPLLVPLGTVALVILVLLTVAGALLLEH